MTDNSRIIPMFANMVASIINFGAGIELNGETARKNTIIVVHFIKNKSN